MRLQLLGFLLLTGIFSAQESDPPEIAKTAFPVRLTPEEEESAQAPQNGCCNQVKACQSSCCHQPSLNCPPLIPRCDPCDCIIDYYNPLIFNGFDLSVEWLYWTVHQKASTFVLTPDGFHQPFPPADNNGFNDGSGKYKYARMDWNSGVRANLGYTFERDAWRLLGQYTYYGTHGSDRVVRSTDLTLYLEPTNKYEFLANSGPDLVNSSIHLRYQVADLLVSRRFLPGCQILFNFFTGATGAWIQEEWKFSYICFENASVPGLATITHNNWSFRGGGMRAGVDTNWHLGKGFGIFNKFSMAALVGSFLQKKSVLLDPPVLPPGFDIFTNPFGHTREDEIWVVPNTQLEFGLNWNHRFCSWAMSLMLGFEINTWYDLHQYHQSMSRPLPANYNHIDYRNSSDVSLWGGNLQLGFSF